MNKSNQIIGCFAIVALITIVNIGNGHMVNAKTSVMFAVDASDIIGHYTYEGIAKVTGIPGSLEDTDIVYLLISGSDIIATYKNMGEHGNFVLKSIDLVSEDD